MISKVGRHKTNFGQCASIDANSPSDSMKPTMAGEVSDDIKITLYNPGKIKIYKSGEAGEVELWEVEQPV